MGDMAYIQRLLRQVNELNEQLNEQQQALRPIFEADRIANEQLEALRPALEAMAEFSHRTGR